MFDSTFFLVNMQKYVKNITLKLSSKEKMYIKDKGYKLAKLFDELSEKGFLRKISKTRERKIITIQDRYLQNHEPIKKLTLTFEHILNKSKRKNGRFLTLHDPYVGEVQFEAHQLASIWGWHYASLCEVMRAFLIEVIHFPKIEKQLQNIKKLPKEKYANPFGLGALKYKLQKVGIQKLDFFNDMDADLRNAFFHLNYKFKKGKLYYYDKDGKTKQIKLYELRLAIINIDRTMLPVMMACIGISKQVL